LSRIALCIKSIGLSCLIAAALTYVSLAVPGRVSAVCGNLGTPIYCPALAYGFPLPFIADSHAISPVGSVARDPLSLVLGEDDVLWPQLGLSTLFWVLVVVVSTLAWRRWTRKRKSKQPDGYPPASGR
jgi:hypothetical protein